MEYYWTLLNNSTSNGIGSSSSSSSSTSNNNTVRGHNGSFTPAPSPAWDLPPPPTTSPADQWSFAGATASSSLYCNPVVDPHLTCLKLGKRHYFEDPAAAEAEAEGVGMPKKGKSAEAVVARCQVEGCEAQLVNAKDYHRRHKVCEMHAKVPKVVLLGIEQRFCQQCSRFHAVAEFDEAKRSCRRRLAGHNERRRKTSQPDHKHYQGRQAQYPQSQLVNNGAGCALSLLSPTNYASDLPARCSAALRELIAEKRASYNQLNRSHVTLDLMQGPDSAFGLRSEEDGDGDGDGDCSHLWKLPLGY